MMEQNNLPTKEISIYIVTFMPMVVIMVFIDDEKSTPEGVHDVKTATES